MLCETEDCSMQWLDRKQVSEGLRLHSAPFRLQVEVQEDWRLTLRCDTVNKPFRDVRVCYDRGRIQAVPGSKASMVSVDRVMDVSLLCPSASGFIKQKYEAAKRLRRYASGRAHMQLSGKGRLPDRTCVTACLERLNCHVSKTHT
jgi:hypothetical protein